MQTLLGASSRRVVPAALFAAQLIFGACSCTSDEARPAWKDEEPDIFDLKLRDGVTQATPAQAQKVRVEPNRLTFPKSAVADVQKEFPVGKPIIGAESTETPENNPFGFMRKVKAVNVEGDSVVVETEPAHIEDIVDGQVRATFDPLAAEAVALPAGVDLDQYFPDYPVGDGTPLGSDAPGQSGQPLRVPPGEVGTIESAINDDVSVSETFDLTGTMKIFKFQKSRTYGSGERQVTVNFVADGTLTSKFKFTPTLRFAFETTLGNIDFVEISARGDFHMENDLDLNVGVTAASGEDPTDLVDLETLLKEGPEKGEGIKKVLAKSGLIAGPRIYGVKTSFRVVVVGDCSFGIQASANAHANVTLDSNMLAGLRYDDGDGWSALKSFDFSKTASASVTGGGGVSVECAVTPRIEWLIADMGGPYLAVRAGIEAHGAYAEFCDNTWQRSGRPDGKVNFDVTPFAKIQAGGVVDAFKVLDFEVGPYTLYSKEFDPLYHLEKTFERSGIGWCIVPCDNRLLDTGETDKDCGGEICRKCNQGQKCTAASDCASDACDADGTCAAGPCEDHQKDGQESDVDCGGPDCKPCTENQVCLSRADCDPWTGGFCSKELDDGKRICTYNLCIDGVHDSSEGDVDCGASPGCARRCSLGEGCNVGADCTTGACNDLTRKCVASRCEDALRDDDETDVDCGPSCPNKCAVGSGCTPHHANQGGADCASGSCNYRNIPAVCVASACEDGRLDGSESDLDCGGSCEKCPENWYCHSDADCTDGLLCHPLTSKCAKPGCNDGRLNGEETSTDCGGSTCAKCGMGKACKANTDCVTDTCSGGRCVGGPCENGVKDANEADVDCGGACGGLRCATGLHCSQAGDCKSNICADGVCSSDPCKDRIRNGDESDADCGGAKCSARCLAGKACNADGDCASAICNATTHLCGSGQCSDGEKNGDETDLDCGGTCATKCAVNKTCTADRDCASGVCNATTLRCVPDRCFDGVKNGSETDTDCGGACQPKCRKDAHCAVARDCQSGACNSSTLSCAADQCSDGRLNGSETGVDCGGSCATKCAVDQGCLVGADCTNPDGLVDVPGYCAVTTKTCTADHCADGVKDVDETDVDCGGSCGKCGNYKGCTRNEDCQSPWCNLHPRNGSPAYCSPNRCDNGLKDGTETDIDCGTSTREGCTGGFLYPCNTGAACTNSLQCGSGYCGTSGVCVARPPESCAEALRRGDTTSGVKELDPDGNGYYLADNAQSSARTPRFLGSQIAPAGWDDPVLTYCDQTTEGGGWTPILYLNSADNADNIWMEYSGLAWSSWAQTGTCSSDAQCTQNGHTGKCITNPGDNRTYCMPSGPMRVGLQGPPQNYTAAGPSTGMTSATIGVAHPTKNIAGGIGGQYGTANDGIQAGNLRFEVWRNGQRVHRVVGGGMPRPDFNGSTGFNVSGLPVSQLVWSHGASAYFNNINVPIDDGAYDGNTLLMRGNGWGMMAQDRYAPPYNYPLTIGTLYMRLSNYGTTPWDGIWAGRYGNASVPQTPNAKRFGVCNSLGINDCNPTVHPAGTVAWNQSELTAPKGGSEVLGGSAGIVIIIWAR